jgi:hypothetical protein
MIRYPKGEYILLVGPEKMKDDDGNIVLKTTLFKNNFDKFDVQHYRFFRMGMNGSEPIEEWICDWDMIEMERNFGVQE